MPRLSNSDYLYNRSELLALLNEKIPIQVHLTHRDQMVLHDYFSPTKPLTDEEAITHRNAVTRADPSLPHRAGKLVKRIEVLRSIDWSKMTEPSGRPVVRHKVVRSLARFEPDLEKLARVIAAQLLHEIKSDAEK